MPRNWRSPGEGAPPQKEGLGARTPEIPTRLAGSGIASRFSERPVHEKLRSVQLTSMERQGAVPIHDFNSGRVLQPPAGRTYPTRLSK